MSELILAEDLRQKIRRRAKRAFEAFDAGSDERFHRISEVSAKSLTYRIPSSMIGAMNYNGPKLIVKRDVRGRVYIATIINYGTSLPETETKKEAESDEEE